jgi:hypothetical protein
MCKGEPPCMKLALAWQISAQSISIRTCAGSACLPPSFRQC